MIGSTFILDYSLLCVNKFCEFNLKGGILLIFNKVKEYCIQNKTSISALEKKCGLGNGTIKGWINSSPRIDSLQKVSKEINIPISELLTDENKTNKGGKP